MDLVISVANTTVHTAGALGVPAWTLVPAGADWRWMRGGATSPWYAAARLFRQPRPGDWDTPLAEVARELASWAGTGGPDG